MQKKAIESPELRDLWRGVSWPLLLIVSVSGLALLCGLAFGLIGPGVLALVIAAVGMYLVIAFRQDELAAVFVIGAHLYLDWYLAFRVVGLLMTITLLIAYALARSERYSWTLPRFLWLWLLWLIASIIPAIRGIFRLYDVFYFYPNVMLGSFLMFWLGTIVARDVARLRLFLQLLTLLATLLALHTLFEVATGIVVLSTSHYDALVNSSAFQVSGTNVHRAESFFTDPNWNGAFMGMLFFVPFGLLVESETFVQRVCYAVAMGLIAIALLSTYSNGAWLGAFAGAIIFVIFIGKGSSRLLVLTCLLLLAVGIVMGFSQQIGYQLQRASEPQEVILRVGAWQTALRVIQAYPLTGVGLGPYAYLELAEPYRVPSQVLPLAHPHDSYLELAALGGLPILAIFLVLLLASWGTCIQTWRWADERTRSLLAGGIAASVALSVNSITINGWTLPPLCAVGWMILGAISSPLLRSQEGSKE